MAKRFPVGPSLLILLGSLGSLLTAAGCGDTVVEDDSLPPPGFNRTALADPTPPPAPVVQQRAPLPPPPQVTRQAPPVAIAPQQQLRRPGIVMVPSDWFPPRNVAQRDWQWIVIHHTATSFGNAAIVTRWHIDRGFDEMGYHFLIGNGTNSGDGQVEVGSRWPKQKWGAHTKTPDNRFNDFGIGICLVGNFDVTRPTAAQMRSLDKLVAFLMKTYHIPLDHVLGHGDCKSTDCPGKNLSVATVRQQVRQILADEGENVEEPQQASSDELMHDVNASN